MWHCRVIPRFTPRAQILFLFSDVNASPILFQIVQNVQQSECSLKVVVIGENNLEICQDLRQIGIEPILISKTSRYRFLHMLAAVIQQTLLSRPMTVLASGQYATILGIFSAFVLRVRRRIFIRHHSIFHTKNKMRLGIFTDLISNYMATQIVAVSKVVRDILIDTEKVDPAKVILIHNGIDTDRFVEIAFLREQPRSLKYDAFQIGVVSRMTGWKGVQHTVAAFIMLHSKFPNAHLNLVGAPSDSYELIKSKLAQLDSSAYSINNWNSDILGFLQKIDIFVHVPIGPHDEAFGLIYLEALASGTRSIFTISGVLNELPNPEKYAVIVPHENSLAIYEAMMNLIESEIPSRELLPDDWLQEYSLSKMGSLYVNLLTEAN
jgi:glycosyltransferase involved in cell wall biosynthesis